jgi:type II restriction enzyme
MNLEMPVTLAQNYNSPAQRARVITEGWAASNLFCPNCPSPELAATPGNTQAIDYRCPRCDQPFQLKGSRVRRDAEGSGRQSSIFGAKIVDAAWEAMMQAIREDRTPNLFVLHYSVDDSCRASAPLADSRIQRQPERLPYNVWMVRSLILVPHFVFTASAVEKRKPLAATARR